jgi:hypothetical protein
MDVHSSSYNLRMMKETKKWMCEWNGFLSGRGFFSRARESGRVVFGIFCGFFGLINFFGNFYFYLEIN